MPNSESASIDKSYADGKILQSVMGAVGVVTFHNPEKRNAMSLDMWAGLGEALADLRDDPSVRVVIMTGAGDKAFISGADIGQFDERRKNLESPEFAKRNAAWRDLLADYPKPTVACIRGFCLGGGMLVAMMADMRIAAEDSQFGIPAAKLGVAYSVDGLRHLVSLVGPSQARLMMFSGMRLSSTEASRIGLVDRIIPTDQLWPFTLDLARTIADNAPLSIAVSKIGIAELMRDPADRDMDRVAKASEICMNSDDFKEGRQAFAEKRRPKFRGR